MAEIPCPRCQTTGTVPDPGLTRWQCRACGHSCFLRRCAACRRVSYVDGFQGYNQSWACTWCAQPNAGFRQRRDRATATAGDLAAELARFTGVAPALGDAPVAGGAPAPDHAPDPDAEPPGQAGRRSRRALTIAAVMLLIVVAGAAIGVGVGHLTPAAGPSATSSASVAPDGPIGTARPAGPARTAPAEARQTSRPVSVTEADVSTVDFDGVGGQLTVVAGPGPVRLTGTLNWTGPPPRASVTRDHTGRALRLTYRCAPASPCTEDYRLTVPAGTTLTLRQPSGQLTLSGLSGRLSITAASADVVARDLKAAHLRASITTGQFDASFDSPPQSVQIDLTRANGTVRVPGTVRYRVSQQVSGGSADVRVPRSDSAGRTIAAALHDSQLALLPS
ncbi:MAG TPA: hypothetical protein VIZ20_19565 [Streptosporangiaceae bacterium]